MEMNDPLQVKVIQQPFVCNCQLQRDYKKKEVFGLYIEPKYLPQQYIQNNIDLAVPLEKVEFDTKITNNISTTKIIQTYKNVYDQYISAQYKFPISTESAFISFQAKFNGKTISGVVKEKEEARKEFKEHKESGNMVALSEISEETKDIMKVDVANIQPNSEIQIEFVYTEELKINSNKFWMYKILSILTPRYCNQQITANNEDFPNQQQRGFFQNLAPNLLLKNNHTNTTTSINIVIVSKSAIEFLRSSTHELMNYRENYNKTEVMVSMNEIKFEKDFTLLYLDSSINQPSVLIGQNDIQSCAQLNFVPNFNNLEVEDVYKAQMSDMGNFQVDMNTARAEFIFVLDRSGSMGGSRIRSAIQALTIFLKSLPTNSYFNVYSFGSSFKAMYTSSINYNQNNLNDALRQIQTFGADMGGTEIYTPLTAIFQTDKMKNMPRQIFLLTDGGVGSPDQITSLIRRQVKTSRVHSIGIGSGASQELVKGSASAGKGKAIFIGDNEDVTGQIIDLLEYSLTPCLDDFKITYDTEKVDSIIPNPENMPCVFKNEPFSMYVFFKPGVSIEEQETTIELTCFDSSVNMNLKYSLKVNKDCKKDNSIFKMGIFKLIKGLQDHLDNPNADMELNQRRNQKQIQKSVKDVRIEKLLNKNLCHKGHLLNFISLQEDRIKYITCDQCNIPCVQSQCGSYRCDQCDYDRCQKCYEQISVQYCSKGHQLNYIGIENPKLTYIQCDMCNYAPKDQNLGTYRCEQCDFDSCETCFKEEQIMVQKKMDEQVKIKFQTAEKDEEQKKFKVQFDDIYFARIVSAKEEIKSLSIQHQILSTQTAFICVIDELDDQKKQQFDSQTNDNKQYAEVQLEKIEFRKQQKQYNQVFAGSQFSQFNNSLHQNMMMMPQQAMSMPQPQMMMPQESKLQSLSRNSRNTIYSPQRSMKKKIKSNYDNGLGSNDSFTNNESNNNNQNVPMMSYIYNNNNNNNNNNMNTNFQQQQREMLFNDFSSPPCQPQYFEQQQQQQNSFARSIQKEIENEDDDDDDDEDDDNCSINEMKSFVQTNKKIDDLLEFDVNVMDNRKEIQQKQKNYQDNCLMEVINMQQFSGNWQYSCKLLNLLQISESQFASTLPQALTTAISDKNVCLDIWITILVISLLDLHFQNKKSTWQLLQRKAISWLNENRNYQWKSAGSVAQGLLC